MNACRIGFTVPTGVTGGKLTASFAPFAAASAMRAMDLTPRGALGCCAGVCVLALSDVRRYDGVAAIFPGAVFGAGIGYGSVDAVASSSAEEYATFSKLR